MSKTSKFRNVSINLIPCQFCSRSFAANRVEKHETACQKVLKKRVPFDSCKQRLCSVDSSTPSHAYEHNVEKTLRPSSKICKNKQLTQKQRPSQSFAIQIRSIKNVNQGKFSTNFEVLEKPSCSSSFINTSSSSLCSSSSSSSSSSSLWASTSSGPSSSSASRPISTSSSSSSSSSSLWASSQSVATTSVCSSSSGTTIRSFPQPHSVFSSSGSSLSSSSTNSGSVPLKSADSYASSSLSSSQNFQKKFNNNNGNFCDKQQTVFTGKQQIISACCKQQPPPQRRSSSSNATSVTSKPTRSKSREDTQIKRNDNKQKDPNIDLNDPYGANLYKEYLRSLESKKSSAQLVQERQRRTWERTLQAEIMQSSSSSSSLHRKSSAHGKWANNSDMSSHSSFSQPTKPTASFNSSSEYELKLMYEMKRGRQRV